MTRGRRRRLQSTCQMLLPIRAAAADLFYRHQFELAPHTRPLSLRDIHAHAAMLMATLDAVVRSLHLNAVLTTAQRLAQRHVGYMKAAAYPESRVLQPRPHRA